MPTGLTNPFSIRSKRAKSTRVYPLTVTSLSPISSLLSPKQRSTKVFAMRRRRVNSCSVWRGRWRVARSIWTRYDGHVSWGCIERITDLFLHQALKQRDTDIYGIDDDDGPGGPPSFSQWSEFLWVWLEPSLCYTGVLDVFTPSTFRRVRPMLFLFVVLLSFLLSFHHPHLAVT